MEEEEQENEEEEDEEDLKTKSKPNKSRKEKELHAIVAWLGMFLKSLSVQDFGLKGMEQEELEFALFFS